jgi:hypothetical protein
MKLLIELSSSIGSQLKTFQMYSNMMSDVTRLVKHSLSLEVGLLIDGVWGLWFLGKNVRNLQILSICGMPLPVDKTFLPKEFSQTYRDCSAVNVLECSP